MARRRQNTAPESTGTPTPRQLEVLRAIHAIRRETGLPPTFRQLGKRVGLRSMTGIRHHMIELEALGLVEWEFKKFRTIRLTDAGRRAIGVAL